MEQSFLSPVWDGELWKKHGCVIKGCNIMHVYMKAKSITHK